MTLPILPTSPIVVVDKSVLPYRRTPLAPINSAWDGAAQVREASVGALRAMAAWVSPDDDESKASYKLPHHESVGPHRTVWRGVVAAMGALLGEHGVDIPDADRPKVYAHLRKHYEDFDREPPEFRDLSDLTDDELAKACGDGALGSTIKDAIDEADADVALGPMTVKTPFVELSRNHDWAAKLCRRYLGDDIDPDAVELWHKQLQPPSVADEVGELGEFEVVQWVSTRDVDRDRDIMLPQGANLSEFKRNPRVLWGHDARELPIGKDIWIKKAPKGAPYGLLAKTLYDGEGFGGEVFRLKKGGFLNSSSVGFIPIKVISRESGEWEDTVKRLVRMFGSEFLVDAMDAERIIAQWILLEHSDVNIPANASAIQVAVAKGLAMPRTTAERIGVDLPAPVRTALPVRRVVPKRTVVHQRTAIRTVSAVSVVKRHVEGLIG